MAGATHSLWGQEGLQSFTSGHTNTVLLHLVTWVTVAINPWGPVMVPVAQNPLVIQELLLSPPQNWWQVGPLQGEQGSQAQGCIFAFSPSGASIGNGNDREHPVPGWSILSDVQSWRFSGVLPMGAFTPKVSLASLQHPEPRCCAGRRCPPVEGAV